jgi:IPT/TIG domain/Metallo-peptidase family M12B Reprolysin-like
MALTPLWLTGHARRAACAALILFATGCGGGGGGEAPANVAGSATPAASPSPSSSPSPSPSPTAAPAITSFSPAIAAAGAQVIVTGTALSSVTAVRVAGVAAAFTPSSATSLLLTVPTGASSGRIEVSGPAGAALSATDLTVMAVPAITTVSPTSARAGDSLNITGTNLNQVKSVLLGNVSLPIGATRSATSLAVTIPTNAASGFLTLVGMDDVARTSAQQITITVPVVLSSFAPTSALIGANVTISGAGLDRVASVSFMGTATTAAITVKTASSMSVAVPAGATSGPITLTVSPTESVRSNTSFTVIPRITVDATAVYNAAAAGAAVTITGTGLDQVSGVTVAGTAATVNSRSATQLVFAAPAGLACGAIALQSTTQPSVAAGNLVVGGGCNAAVNIAGIEFAQVQSQNAGSQYQRLALGKETWVRAYVTSTTAGRAAPPVRLTAYSGTTLLGSIDMTGPGTLPQLAAGAAPPDTMRYDFTQTFRASLPVAWVASGLKVRVDVDPANAAGLLTTQEATPVTGSATRLEVVMVPLVSGSNVPTMPTATQVLDELSRALPIPRDQITVTFRAPYTVAATVDGVDSEAEWENTLSELDQLREMEAPTKLYYGLVRPVVSSGIAGIGYVNGVTSNSPSLSSLGWDASRSSWSRTMVHELGHNFSRRHAPCGGVASSDANYPYAGGVMPAVPLFDGNTDTLLAPGSGAERTDVMGYCGGRWFSDYNMSFVQQFLEFQRSRGNLSVEGKPSAPEVSLIVVSGTITAQGARIESVRPATGAAQYLDTGTHSLELVTSDGRQIVVPVLAKSIDHAEPGTMHFSARIPNPGQLAKLRLVHEGKVLGQIAESAQLGTQKPGSDESPSAQVREVGTSAHFTWSAAAYPIATLTHVSASGQRTVLALQARGGKASVDVSALPRGGAFEVGLSNGLNVQTLTLAR